MNTKNRSNVSRLKIGALMAIAVMGITALPVGTRADLTKADNNTTLNLMASWVSNATPTVSDVLIWDSTIVATNTVGVGSSINLAVSGVRILNPGGLITINGGGGTLTLGSVGIDMSVATQSLTINAPIALSASQSWNVNAGRVLTIGGAVSTAGNGITKTGAGNATVSGVISGSTIITNNGSGGLYFNSTHQTFTGSLILNNGVTWINFNNAGNDTNMLNAAVNLTLAGGTLTVNTTTAATGSNTQNFTNAVSLLAGESVIAPTRSGSGSNIALNFNAGITRSVGGTLDAVFNNANTHMLITTTNGTSGIIGGWFVVSSTTGAPQPTSWARFASGADVTNGVTFQTLFSAASQNTDITANVAATAGGTSGSVRFNNAIVTPTLTINGANIIGSGGVLSTFNVGTNSALITSTNLATDTLTSGNGTDLIFHQHNTNATFTVASTLANNGATAIAITKSGPGTLALTGTNTNTGAMYLNNGVVLVTKNSNLGAVATGAQINISGGILSANGTFDMNNGAAGTADRAIAIGLKGATLDVTTNNRLGVSGVVSGAGALNKTGAGSLVLSGANTFSGVFNISNGVVALNNTSGSGSGTGNIALTGSSTLTGSGTASGAVSTAAGTHIAPGNNGVGTLTVGSLNVVASTVYDFEIGDILNVSGANGLTINGGSINLFYPGTNTAFSVPGIYNLFQYTGTLNGTGAGALAVANGTNGATYTFNSTGTFVTVTVANNNVKTWIVDASGTWGDAGNWDNGVPDAPDGQAIFGPVATNIRNVDLLQSRTVASLSFNTPNVGSGYVIGSSNGSSLILDNGVNTLNVGVTAGVQAITAAVQLNSSTFINVAAGTSITLSGVISSTAVNTPTPGISIVGAGKVSLTGVNTYLGTTNISSASTVQLGDGTLAASFGPGLATNVGKLTVSNNALVPNLGNAGTVTANVGSTITSITNTNIFSNSGTVANLINSGTATLNAGSLGNATNSAAIIYNGGTATGTIVNTGLITLNSTSPLSIDAVITGAGTLTQAAAGVTTLNGASTRTGPTNINAGTIGLGASGALGTGNIAIAAAAMLDVSGHNVITPSLTGAGTVNNSSGTNGTLTINLPTGTNNTAFSGIIENTGSPLTVVYGGAGTANGGTINLTGVSTYTGKTMFSNGTFNGATVIVGVTNAIPAASEIDLLSTNSVRDLLLANNVTLNSNIVVTSNQTAGNSEMMAVSGTNSAATYAGNVTNTNALVTSSTDASNSAVRFGSGVISNTLTLTGNISGAPTATNVANANSTIVNFSNGNIILSGAVVNTWSNAEFILGRSTATNITMNGATVTSNVAAGSEGGNMGGSSGQAGNTFVRVDNASAINTNLGNFNLSAGAAASTTNMYITGGSTLRAGGLTKTSTGPTTLTLDNGTLIGTRTSTFLANNAATTFVLGAGGGFLTAETGANMTISQPLTGGALTVTNGPGTVTLSGNNSYTGTTTVNGNLNVTGTLTAASVITVNNGGMFGANGTVGNVTVLSGGKLAPAGAQSIGVMTTNDLTINSGGFINFDLSSTLGSDLLKVNGVTTLGVNTININLFDSLTGLAYGKNGTYSLFNLPAPVGDISPYASTFNIFNAASGATYTWGISGVNPNVITLNIAGLATVSNWAVDADGNWGTAANWDTNPDFPTAALDQATFGNVISTNRTINLEGSHTVGSIIFNSTASYTIAPGAGNLVMDNGGGAASITTTGIQTINAPLVANSALSLVFVGGSLTLGGGVTANSSVSSFIPTGSALSVSGGINAAGSIAFNATGSTETFAGGLTSASNIALTGSTSTMTVAGGVSATGSLSLSGTSTTITLGGPISAAGVSATNNSSVFTLNGNVTSTAALAFAGATGVTTINGDINAGGNSLALTGTGSLVLTGTDTYGTTSVGTGSTLQLGNNTATGSLGSGAVTNAGTVAFKYSGPVTVGNVISGAGAVTTIGTGKVTLTAANLYTGATTVANGSSLAIDYTAGSLASTTTITTAGTLAFLGGNAPATQIFSTNLTLQNGANLRIVGGAGLPMSVTTGGATIPANASVTINVDGTTGPASFTPGAFSFGTNAIINANVGGAFPSTLTLSNGGYPAGLTLNVTANGLAAFTGATTTFNAGSTVNVGGSGSNLTAGTAVLSSTVNVTDGGSATFGATTFNAGSVLNVTGGALGASVTMGNLTFNGAGSINLSGSPTAGTLTFGTQTYTVRGEYNVATGNAINLGALGRGGLGAVNFAGAGTFNSSVANGPAGIIGGWATVNGTEFASSDGSVITAAGSSVDDAWAPDNNTSVTTSGNPADSSTTNSLRFKTAGANIVTLSGVNTVTSGAILVASDVGANTTTLTGGSITSGQDIVLNQRNTAGDLVVNTVLSATNINKVGPGTVVFSAKPTGSFQIAEGSVKPSGDNLLTTGAWNITTGAHVDLNGFNQTITTFGTGTGTVINSSGTTSTLTVNTTGNVVVLANTNFAVTGNVNLEKTGTGTLTISGQQSYTGKTIVTSGTIFVDPTVVNVNVMPTASILTMQGGTLLTNNITNVTSGIKFASTTISSGASAINENTRTSNAHPYILLGAITRNVGSVVDINGNLGSGSIRTDATTGIFTSTANGASGILGGWATANGGVDWAVKDTGSSSSVDATQQHIYGVPNSTTTAYTASIFNATANTDMSASFTAAAGSTGGSVRFNNASVQTLTLGGAGTIGSGGILVTTNVAGNASTITGGTLTSGNGQDLIVIQNNTNAAGALNIASVIANPDVGNIGLTKAGGGILNLTAINTYTGPTTVLAGTLRVNGQLQGASAVSVLSGATLGGNGSIAGTVNVAGGGNLSLVDGVATNVLTLGSNLTVGGATTASTFRFELAAGGVSDLINLGSNQLIVNPGGANFVLTDLGMTTGTYTLMTFASGTNLAGLVGGTTSAGFSSATININPTSVTVSVTAPAAPVDAYWTGQFSTAWNGNSGGNANFNDAVSAGNNTLQLPGAASNVIFATTSPAVSAANLSTTLGQSFSVNSVQVQAGLAGPVTIAQGTTGTLTIGSGGISVDPASAGLTISAPVAVNVSETWTGGTSAASPLKVSGIVSGTGSVTIGGYVKLTGTAANTFTGSTTVSGILDDARTTTSASVFGAAPLVAGGGTLIMSGTTGANLPVINIGAGSLTISNVVAAGTDGAAGNPNTNIPSSITGSGRLILAMGGTSSNFSVTNVGVFSGFTGTLAVTSGYIRAVSASNDHGFGGLTLDLSSDGGLRNRDGGNITVGALTGDSTGYVSGALNNGTVPTTLTLGSVASSTFNGNFLAGATNSNPSFLNIIKTGATTLSLTGTGNNYSGTTTISQGVLSVNDISSGGITTSATSNGTSTLIVGSAAGLDVGMQVTGDSLAIGAGTTVANGTVNTFVQGLTITSINGTTLTLSGNAPASNANITNLRIGRGAPLGLSPNAAGNVVLDGGTLRYTGTGTSTDRLFTVNATGGAIESSGSGPVNFTNTGALALGGAARTLTLGGTNTGANTLAAAIGSTTALSKTGAGTWIISGTSNSFGQVQSTAGMLQIAATAGARNTPASTLKLQSYVAATGRIDLTNHDVIVGNTSIAQITTDYLAGFDDNNPGGIISSTAGANNAFFIPLDATAFSLTDFNSVPIDQPNSVILWYRVFGDVDLNGIVNADDFSVIAGNFGSPTPGVNDIFTSWSSGDADLNGIVNADDFSVVAGNFGASITGGDIQPLAAFRSLGDFAAVPEPASLFLLVAGSAGMLLRRTRRRQ